MVQKEFRVLINGLSPETTKAELKELFEPYGEVAYARVCTDPHTGAPTGSGYMSFYEEDFGLKSVAALNNTAFNGSEIKVRMAPPQTGQKKPCKEFASGRGCAFGVKCRYEHVVIERTDHTRFDDSSCAIQVKKQRQLEPDIQVRNLCSLGYHMYFTREYGDLN